MVAMWHYAQAIAAVRSGPDRGRRRHHAALVERSGSEIEAMLVWERYS
jgi:hypothetical protein